MFVGSGTTAAPPVGFGAKSSAYPPDARLSAPERTLASGPPGFSRQPVNRAQQAAQGPQKLNSANKVRPAPLPVALHAQVIMLISSKTRS